jgi:hypothetical protein
MSKGDIDALDILERWDIRGHVYTREGLGLPARKAIDSAVMSDSTLFSK